MSSRYKECEQQIVARLRTATSLKQVIRANSPNKGNLTGGTAAVVSVYGTSPARSAPWALGVVMGKRWVNEWIHFIVTLIGGTSGGASDPEPIRLASDEIRQLLIGWAPAPFAAYKVMETVDTDGEIPGEDDPDISLSCLYIFGVSQEGVVAQ